MNPVACFLLLSLLMIGPCVPGSTEPAGANEPGSNPKIGVVHTASLITGSLVAAGFATYHGIIQFGFESEWQPAENAALYGATVAVATATSLLTTWAMAELNVRVRPHPVLAALMNAGVGLAAGACIGGLSYAAFFGIAHAFDPTFMHGADTWWQAAGQGLFGGAAFGGLIGVLPGAAAGLAVRLYLGPAS